MSWIKAKGRGGSRLLVRKQQKRPAVFFQLALGYRDGSGIVRAEQAVPKVCHRGKRCIRYSVKKAM